MTNPEIMKAAREALKGKWGTAILTFLIYNLIMSIGSLTAQVDSGVNFMYSVVPLIFGGPLALGAAGFSLAIARRQEAKLEQLFDGFKYFINSMLTYWLMIVTILLWSLLLIVPGIIRAFSYAMTFYILADQPTLDAKAALAQSRSMMDGHKLRLFYLCLRFLGLALLCILTLGIGFLWLIPYVNVTMATFYEDLGREERMDLV